MLNTQAVSLMPAGQEDPNWLNKLKAHLIIAHVKEAFEDMLALLRVGAHQDLDSCRSFSRDWQAFNSNMKGMHKSGSLKMIL
jgi:hypothetical protein